MIETLEKAIARRIMRDIRWLMKTGNAPPIRKQRTRWFREALNRRNRTAPLLGDKLTAVIFDDA